MIISLPVKDRPIGEGARVSLAAGSDPSIFLVSLVR